MKLYLSSFRLGESPEQLAELADGKGPFAFIFNALDYFTDFEKKNAVIARGVEDLQRIGLESHPIDLREYFDSPRELRTALENYRAVFVTGGNAFILRRALERSGLDSYLRERMDDEDFLYAGYSAGACVAGPTMKGLHLVDDPEEVPDGYLPEVSWGGLSLIDYNIAPHFSSDHPESNAINKVVSYWIENKILFRALRDGEVLVHSSSSQQIAGLNRMGASPFCQSARRWAAIRHTWNTLLFAIFCEVHQEIDNHVAKRVP